MKTTQILIAGFGGQGILFAGKFLAYKGLLEDLQVSWLPSYGPEMRGGTANCSVCLSSRPIGSPLVLEPDALVVMNNPSYDKFIDTVVPGGTVVIDSALVDRKTSRTDITALYVPATKLAQENGMGKLANLIMLGALWKATGFTTMEALQAAIEKVVPPSKKELVELNRKAIQLGMD